MLLNVCALFLCRPEEMLGLVQLAASMLLVVDYALFMAATEMLGCWLEATERHTALGLLNVVFEVISRTDDYVRKPHLIRWYQELSKNTAGKSSQVECSTAACT